MGSRVLKGTSRVADDDARLLLALLAGSATVHAVDVDAECWRAVAEMAAWHDMQPALRHAVAALASVALPADVREPLDTSHTLALMRAESRRRQLAEVLAALAAADVPTIVLKGAYLAEHVWAAPALRPMTDIDLLVPGERLARAQETLAALGYGPNGDPSIAPRARHAPALRRRGRLPVELHHTIEPCSPPFGLTLDAMWARSVACEVAGVGARALAPEDLLLHIAIHMGHSHILGSWLPRVCDVQGWTARFGATADWDAVVRGARAAGARRFVNAALALAHRTLDADVPAEVLAALHAPQDEATVAHATTLLATPPLLVASATSLTDPRDSMLARARKVARALLVSSAGRMRAGRGGGLLPRGYGARWTAVARMVLLPSGPSMARRVASVRALRDWATSVD